MAFCGCAFKLLQVYAFGCSLLAFSAFSFDFNLERDGSVLAAVRRCRCNTIELWLQKKRNGLLKLPSFEEIVSNTQSFQDDYKGFRLWLPKHCDIIKLENTSKILQIDAQNTNQGVLEVWINDDPLVDCVASILKCKRKTLCIGIKTGAQAKQFTPRKLLMFNPKSSTETNAIQPFKIILMVSVFCLMVIVIALCGKASEKNSKKSVSHAVVSHHCNHDSVQIMSCKNIESPQKSDSNSYETIDIKVDKKGALEKDGNSNNREPVVLNADLKGGDSGNVKRNIEGEDIKNGNIESGNEIREENMANPENEIHEVGTKTHNEHALKGNAKNSTRKNKDLKHKQRSEEMRSKRAQTAPEQTGHEASKGKTRFSLKSRSSRNSTKMYEEPKVSKQPKLGISKQMSVDYDTPFALGRPTRAPGDRRSFIHRELPKRPSEERNDEFDEHYETVGNVPSSPATQQVLSTQNDTASDLYDSVDDAVVVEGQSQARLTNVESQYESVEVLNTTCNTGTLTTKNVSNTYEYPSGEYAVPDVTKSRSLSETCPGPSHPQADGQRKAMSLGEDTKTPQYPAEEDERELSKVIEPYTITYKKGDNIVQETSSSDHVRIPVEKSPPELSPDEKEELYAKVDREKQKQDRLEQARHTEGTEEDEVLGEGASEASASVPAVSDDDSIYELVNDSQKQEGETKARTNHSFIDEHQSPPMAGTEPSEETLENNTDFEKTEDHLLYEEVAKV